ncbi:hypothetical protein N7488_011139 [Penicillium malachiteum]|nr:hypothetical protein N7488_011139 [Penicillium malachiteum]
MDSNPLFEIPERVSSLLSPLHLGSSTKTRQRLVSTASSRMSVESTALEFLDAKIEALQTEEGYLQQIKAGLNDGENDKIIFKGDFYI